MKDKSKDKIRLKHILEAIADAMFFMEGRTFQSLCDDKMLLAAVECKVEIIGEAANHISSETQEKHALMPWRQIIGFRNVISHEYFAIDLNILHDILSDKLPDLAISMQIILENIEE